MITSLFLILTIGITAFTYTDLNHDSAFFSVFLFLVVLASHIALSIWLVIAFNIKGSTSSAGGDSSGGSFFGGDGGDGD